MPVTLTILFAKSVMKISRILGRGGGSALPGLLAWRLDRNILAKLVDGLDEVIVVTGTNGKTTTVKLLAATLGGDDLIINRSGSNLERGIISSLIEASDWRGVLPGSRALLEVDEAALAKLGTVLRPRLLVVNNLFRDQLDRYGELDTIAEGLGDMIDEQQPTLVLNADDPLVAGLARHAKKDAIFFGVANSVPGKEAVEESADSDRCYVCGKALDYSKVFFSHLGHYRCPDGHIERPPATVELTDFKSTDGTGGNITVTADGKPYSHNLQLPGLYNAYNALAALAATSALGNEPKTALQVIGKVQPAFGRVEEIEYRGRFVKLLLVKNPAGFNQVLSTFLVPVKKQQVLVAINDKIADGRDVSWLWDVDIEQLCSNKHNIRVSGIRAQDMALRFKYAGLEVDIEEDLDRAIEASLDETEPGATLFILPTYTAMLKVRQLLPLRRPGGVE